MKQGFSIRILDKNAICGDCDANVRLWKQFGGAAPTKIRGATFEDIPFKLPIRLKAAKFALRQDDYYSEPVYAVLHADEEGLQCLFVFRFVRTSGAFDIVRCLGKCKVKQYWEIVRETIWQKQEDIEFLAGKHSIDF